MSETGTAAEITPSGRADSALLPTLAVLGAVSLWGAAFPAMRVTIKVLGPWGVMWVR